MFVCEDLAGKCDQLSVHLNTFALSKLEDRLCSLFFADHFGARTVFLDHCAAEI